MQRLEVSGAVRPIYGSLGVKRLITSTCHSLFLTSYLTECFNSGVQLKSNIVLQFYRNIKIQWNLDICG